MTQNSGPWMNRAFVLAFLVLTFFCWCPIGYGAYGPVELIFGIPSWAVAAFAFGAVLFVLEWIYLFYSGEAMNDEELPGIIAQLEALDLDRPASAESNRAKEGE